MSAPMDWDDPAARARLIDRVGPAEYERLQAEHWKATTVATVNGYAIRPVQSRFGQLFAVHGTRTAYRTMREAQAYAESLPAREVEP